MAVDRLGVGTDNRIGAEREWALTERGHRRVVDGKESARKLRRARGGGDIANVEARIGRRLDQHQFESREAAVEKSCRRTLFDARAKRLQELGG